METSRTITYSCVWLFFAEREFRGFQGETTITSYGGGVGTWVEKEGKGVTVGREFWTYKETLLLVLNTVSLIKANQPLVLKTE